MQCGVNVVCALHNTTAAKPLHNTNNVERAMAHRATAIMPICLLFFTNEHPLMTTRNIYALFFLSLFSLTLLGCGATSTREGTGEYIDDTVITTKVKAAILNTASLKVSEINVETFKGVVQLSGFVNSAEDINTAVRVAGDVAGVTAVKNAMRVK